MNDLSSVGASLGYTQLGGGAKVSGADAATPSAARQAAEQFANAFDQADVAAVEYARGEGSAQAVVEAMAQAELALQTAVTIRDRVVEAYQEILRMPV